MAHSLKSKSLYFQKSKKSNMMTRTMRNPIIQKNLIKIRQHFSNAVERDDVYKKIMEFGQNLPKLSSEFHTPEFEVQGCQSKMFLRTIEEDGVLFFEAFSDALISAGLASILINFYQGADPEAILKHKPDFLADMNITNSLSLNRSNGLSQILLRIQQDALRHLVQKRST